MYYNTFWILKNSSLLPPSSEGKNIYIGAKEFSLHCSRPLRIFLKIRPFPLHPTPLRANPNQQRLCGWRAADGTPAVWRGRTACSRSVLRSWCHHQPPRVRQQISFNHSGLVSKKVRAEASITPQIETSSGMSWREPCATGARERR